MRVLVDQAAQHRFSADPFAVDVDHGGAGSVAFIVWDALAYALVRPGRVVVRLVLGQDGTQMSLAEDQHAIQELSALIDALAPGRRVITFDNTGVGGSTGTTPDTVEQMARDAIAFLTAMQITQADILGFSIGSFVAQQIALVRPAIVRRLVLASSAPQGAVGMHGWAPAVIGAIGTPNTTPEAYLDVFFTQSASSRQAGQHALRRMYARTEGRDQATTWATREAQYDAVCTWGIPDHALQRLSALQMPVFVTNGDSDPMILPHYSYLLAGLIPHAQVKIYPDSAPASSFSITPSSPPTSTHSLPPAKTPRSRHLHWMGLVAPATPWSRSSGGHVRASARVFYGRDPPQERDSLARFMKSCEGGSP